MSVFLETNQYGILQKHTELRDVSLCKSNSLLVVTVIGRYIITTNVVSVITASELLPLVQKLIDQN